MKVIIIGGVAGGATSAARLRRLNEENHIVVFEKGPYISYANCGLPYYIGGRKRQSICTNSRRIWKTIQFGCTREHRSVKH